MNCDLFVRDVFHHRDIKNLVLNAKDIPNFVCCDGQFLPFKDDCFEEVFSSQVIEHFDNPFRFLRELIRVSNNLVVVETVHRLGEKFKVKRGKRSWIKSHHLSNFNFSWFSRSAFALHCKILRRYIISYYYFPHEYCTLFRVPYEFGVVLTKNG